MRGLGSLVAVLALLCVVHCAASATEELDADGFSQLNSERDDVFDHVVQTLQEVTAQGQALERKLKSTQNKLDDTAESLAACLADKAQQSQKKSDTVTQKVYNDCVKQSQLAREDSDKANAEVKQLRADLKVAKQASKDAAAACDQQTPGVDPRCITELEHLRQEYQHLQREHNQVKATLANAQKRLDNPGAFATACVTSPVVSAAVAAANTPDIAALGGSEAVNFWGGVGALVALILLYMGLNNSNKRRY